MRLLHLSCPRCQINDADLPENKRIITKTRKQWYGTKRVAIRVAHLPHYDLKLGHWISHPYAQAYLEECNVIINKHKCQTCGHRWKTKEMVRKS